MSKCRVEKRLWKDPLQITDYTCLYFELDVDHTPQRGEQLREGRWFSGPLVRVVWNAGEETFKCRVDDEAPSIDRDYEYGYEFILQNALMEGWKSCEKRGIES